MGLLRFLRLFRLIRLLRLLKVSEYVANLEEKFQAAVAEKQEVEDYANGLMQREDLAKRLVGGLASENERWVHEGESCRCRPRALHSLHRGPLSRFGGRDSGAP